MLQRSRTRQRIRPLRLPSSVSAFLTESVHVPVVLHLKRMTAEQDKHQRAHLQAHIRRSRGSFSCRVCN